MTTILKDYTKIETFQEGDLIKINDSPLQRIKKSAKGRVLSVEGNFETDKCVMLMVLFRVNKKDVIFPCSSKRVSFISHKNEIDEELPDAENVEEIDDLEV